MQEIAFKSLDEILLNMDSDQGDQLVSETSDPEAGYYEKKVIKKGPGYMEMTVVQSSSKGATDEIDDFFSDFFGIGDYLDNLDVADEPLDQDSAQNEDQDSESESQFSENQQQAEQEAMAEMFGFIEAMS